MALDNLMSLQGVRMRCLGVDPIPYNRRLTLKPMLLVCGTPAHSSP